MILYFNLQQQKLLIVNFKFVNLYIIGTYIKKTINIEGKTKITFSLS